MTYDQWKTTDPRDYEPEPEEQISELELCYGQIHSLQEDLKYIALVHTDRAKELTTALIEALEYFKARYDVKDGDNGKQLPNEEMRLGTMIEETLYGIRF